MSFFSVSFSSDEEDEFSDFPENEFDIEDVQHLIFIHGDNALEEVGWFIENNDNIDEFDNSELTLLHNASMAGAVGIVEVLLDNGADANSLSNTRDWIHGTTPLHMAMEHRIITEDIIRIARLLIQHGGNINTQDINGATPLHFAVSRNNIELVELLLENGADTTIISNNHGGTVLDLATRSRLDNMVQIIEEHQRPRRTKSAIRSF